MTDTLPKVSNNASDAGGKPSTDNATAPTPQSGDSKLPKIRDKRDSTSDKQTKAERERKKAQDLKN